MVQKNMKSAFCADDAAAGVVAGSKTEENNKTTFVR